MSVALCFGWKLLKGCQLPVSDSTINDQIDEKEKIRSTIYAGKKRIMPSGKL